MEPRRNTRWLPILLVAWSTLDIAVHVAVDMVEPLRITGNVAAIVAGLIVLAGIVRAAAPYVVGLAAVVVVGLNGVESFLHGYLLPMLVFVGVSVLLLLLMARAAAIDARGTSVSGPKPVALRRWAPLAATLAGVALIALVGQPDTSGPFPRAAGPVTPFEPTSLVAYHGGYWVATMDVDGSPFPATIINDLHVDADTNRVTVYAQNRVRGRVVAPAQVGPGECTEANGQTVCFHPDAVYLNGSGQESMEADGTGGWWVKHSWVLGGEGYDNCELRPAETYDDCFYVEGDLLDDGLTMKIGGEIRGFEFFNTRLPVLRDGDVTYLVTRFGPARVDAEPGSEDASPTVQFVLPLECQETASALDGVTRGCPTFPPTP